MINAILGIKQQQGQSFDEAGKRIPVTRISTGTCFVIAVKTVDTDGYNALKLGIGSRRKKTLTQPEMGVIKKAGLENSPPRFLKEIDIDDSSTLPSELKSGFEVKAEQVFRVGDMVQVTGTSKGMGFAGPVKRHHFKGGPKTHGQSDRERAPGAIGSTTTPGRVYKGKRMAGRMGNNTVTIKGLKIVAIDTEKNILTVSGVVPGVRNSLVVIKKTSTTAN